MKKAGRNISPVLSALMVANPDSDQSNKISVVGAAPVTASGGTWYAAPWVWVVGAGVLVLLMAMFNKRRARRTH
jgi:hypothetical protein